MAEADGVALEDDPLGFLVELRDATRRI